MKRQQRVRRLQRRGIQHVGQLLAIILDEIDRDEANGTSVRASQSVATTIPLLSEMSDGTGQSTFAFYQSSTQ